MNVGVRELRDSLSRHLAEVQAGRSITVTDHGRPVARIVPIDEHTTLDRLIAEGRVTPAENRKRSLPRPITVSGSVSEFIAEQRR